MDVQNQILLYLVDDAAQKLRKKRNASQLVREFQTLRECVQRNEPADIGAWHGVFQHCHVLYGQLGGTLTADHWQSPAFDASYANEVGDEQGKILANINDYKRDQHPVGIAYEKAYVREYIPRLFGAPTAFATTSGMAALTVAALVVRQRLPDTYRIAVGRHSYFENQELLHMMFPDDRITIFDEASPAALADIAPHAIFFDLLANDPSMTVADVSRIYAFAGKLRHHVDMVIDTTCVSMEHFRMPAHAYLARNVSLMAYESLNKFHQFGLDRTTGGILWAHGIPADTIYRVRDHAGVNISEAAAATMPSPNKKVHAGYLQRLATNAAEIARAISSLPHVRASYPGLASHAGFRTAKRIGYTGAFVAIEFPGASYRTYRAVMQSVVREAKKSHVPLLAGSTFGTPVTRVYTWSPRSPFENIFLRISPGLESPEEMVRVIDVLTRVLASV